MKKTSYLLVLISLPLFISAGIKSIGEPLFKWSKHEVIVCWVDDKEIPLNTLSPKQVEMTQLHAKPWISLKTKLKESVEKIIKTEYTAKKTGIHFVGWKSCEETKDFDLVIIVSSSSSPLAGRALIGQGTSSDEIVASVKISDIDKRKSFVYLNSKNTFPAITEEQNLQINALHEFGHVAGLRHEHARDEAKKDPLCKRHILTETTYQNSQIYGEYDPTSIMGYCFIDMLSLKGLTVKDNTIFNDLEDDKLIDREDGIINFKIGLSSGDQKTLQCLYFSSKDLEGVKCSK